MNDFILSLMLLGALSSDRTASPFWQNANRFGTMPESSGAIALVQAGTSFDKSKTFQWKWGLSLGALSDTRTDSQKGKVRPVANEAFVAARWKCLGLEVGMAHPKQHFLAPGEGSGTMAYNLGTLSTTGGNMILSGNAPTMPGYTARLYPVAIPGTKDRLKIMGRFGDYRTIDERYVKGALVHNTSLGVIVGLNRKNTLNFTFALDHYSMWGGTSPELGKLPSDFRNYIRMLLGSSAPADEPGYSPGDVVNVLGNHLGHYIFRFDYRGRGWKLALQHDHPYEDKGGMKMKNAPDGVNTVAFSFDDHNRWVSDVVYEFQYTLWQGGTYERRAATEEEIAAGTDPRLYQEPDGSWSLIKGGNDDYFRNHEYRSGWTHGGLTIGDPLISPTNNRILAHHLGIGGKLFRKFPYRFMLTWSRNLGRYALNPDGNDLRGLPFRETLSPQIHQISGGFQCEAPLLKKRLFVVPALFWDCGDFRPANLGGTLALRVLIF